MLRPKLSSMLNPCSVAVSLPPSLQTQALGFHRWRRRLRPLHQHWPDSLISEILLPRWMGQHFNPFWPPFSRDHSQFRRRSSRFPLAIRLQVYQILPVF